MNIFLSVLFGWLGLVGVSATVHMIRRSVRDGHYDLLFFPALMAGLSAIAIGAAIYLNTPEGM